MFYCVIQKCLYNLWDNAVFWSCVWICFIAPFRIIHDLIVFVQLTWIHLWSAPSKSLLISSSVITCEHLTHCLAPAHFLYSVVPMVTCRDFISTRVFYLILSLFICSCGVVSAALTLYLKITLSSMISCHLGLNNFSDMWKIWELIIIINLFLERRYQSVWFEASSFLWIVLIKWLKFWPLSCLIKEAFLSFSNS